MSVAPARDMHLFSPDPRLRGLVRHFLVIEAPEGRMQTVLPDTSVVAAIRFRGDCVIDGTLAPQAAISGLRDTARRIAYGRGGASIMAAFTHTGAACFLRVPPDAFFNATIPMDAALGTAHELSLLREQLAEATHHHERVGIFERFLMARLLRTTPARDLLIDVAVERLVAAKEPLRMKDLVRHIGLSQRALERRFRRVVGSTPKKFSSIVRLRKVTQMRRGVGSDLTDLAFQAGYYDQSHFIHDMKRFTGVAPGVFFQQRAAFC